MLNMYVSYFDEAKPFNENFAATRLGYEWFVMRYDKKSMRRIRMKWKRYNTVQNVSIFRNGTATIRARRYNNVFSEGHVNTHGDIVIFPQYTVAYHFMNGYAPVLKGRRIRRSLRFINLKGDVVKYGYFNTVGIYGDYKWPVKRFGYWGYLDTRKKLKETIFYAYEKAMPFSDGKAFIMEKDSDKYICIDDKGNRLFDSEYDYPFPFSDGSALILKNDIGGKKHHGYMHGFGYINPDNTWLIEPSFFVARPFKHGRAIVGVRRTNGSVVFGFIDKEGSFKIKPKYEQCYDFSEDVAAVCKNGLWGYIDKEGNTVIPCKYLRASSFNNWCALVEDEPMKFRYINKKGEILRFRFNYNQRNIGY